MSTEGEVTNGEIVRRLEAIHEEMRHMSASFVRAELYESQRQESGRRMGEIEHDVAVEKAAREADKLEADRRYRTTVNLFIGGFISIAGGAFLLVLQLVAK